MVAADPMTSLPVHTSTLRVLREFKTGAQNWDAFLLELLERELDREDIEYGRKVLDDYHSRQASATPRSTRKSSAARRK